MFCAGPKKDLYLQPFALYIFAGPRADSRNIPILNRLLIKHPGPGATEYKGGDTGLPSDAICPVVILHGFC